MDDSDDFIIIACKGPPYCDHVADDGKSDQMNTCQMCTRINIAPDGTETRYDPPIN